MSLVLARDHSWRQHQQNLQILCPCNLHFWGRGPPENQYGRRSLSSLWQHGCLPLLFSREWLQKEGERSEFRLWWMRWQVNSRELTVSRWEHIISGIQCQIRDLDIIDFGTDGRICIVFLVWWIPKLRRCEVVIKFSYGTTLEHCIKINLALENGTLPTMRKMVHLVWHWTKEKDFKTRGYSWSILVEMVDKILGEMLIKQKSI